MSFSFTKKNSFTTIDTLYNSRLSLSCVYINVMDNQLILNIAFSIIGLIVGWLFKVVFTYVTKIQQDCNHNSERQAQDYRKLNEKITSLALSIPEKYVSKNDFNQLVKTVHHRFDRLEEKIDELKK